jgi:hypothetical protein
MEEELILYGMYCTVIINTVLYNEDARLTQCMYYYIPYTLKYIHTGKLKIQYSVSSKYTTRDLLYCSRSTVGLLIHCQCHGRELLFLEECGDVNLVPSGSRPVPNIATSLTSTLPLAPFFLFAG